MNLNFRKLLLAVGLSLFAMSASAAAMLLPAQPTAEQSQTDTAEELFQKGLTAYNKSHLDTAFKYYSQAAEMGNVDAQNALGFLYSYGLGTKQDYAKAFEWYSNSAQQGNADGQCELANCYYFGFGTQQDYAKAIEWYSMSAQQGNADAQIALGYCYCHGQGTSKDLEQAKYWLEKAAAQGNQSAKEYLENLF